MRESRFIPGPWSVRYSGETPDGDPYYFVQARKDSPFTENGEYLNVSGVMCEKTANLIGAAPELYEALSNLLSRCGNDADAHAWFLEEQEAAIKALAKARGE